MLIEYKNHNIFAFSDTHGLNDRLDIPKDADILICAGDCIREDNMLYMHDDYLKFLNWYSHLDAKLKIYVPGNHEVYFEMHPEEAMQMIPSSIVLLEDSGIEFDGIYFFGVACRPWIFKDTENKVPKGVDFLISYGPAEGHLDNYIGCQMLKMMIDESKPKHHIFGHVHEEGGKTESTETTTFYNVSMYNQLKYHYPFMKENQELTNGIIDGIEGDIINMYLVDNSGDEEGKCLLPLRKKLINETVISHQEDYIDAIKAFNNCLTDALREMCDRANRIFDDISKHKEYGDEIKLKASLYLSKRYPEAHPIRSEDRQDLWDALLYYQCRDGYSSGITTYYLPRGACGYPFELFTGLNGSSSSKIEGFDPELTKDLKLTDQFRHLYNHTEFALTDFIYVRDFYSEINIEILKGKDDE